MWVKLSEQREEQSQWEQRKKQDPDHVGPLTGMLETYILKEMGLHWEEGRCLSGKVACPKLCFKNIT